MAIVITEPITTHKAVNFFDAEKTIAVSKVLKPNNPICICSIICPFNNANKIPIKDAVNAYKAVIGLLIKTPIKKGCLIIC